MLITTSPLQFLLLLFCFTLTKCSFLNLSDETIDPDCEKPLLNETLQASDSDDLVYMRENVFSQFQYVEENSSDSSTTTSKSSDMILESFVPARKVEAGVVICFYLLLFKMVWPPSTDHLIVLEFIIFCAIMHVMQLYIGYNIKTCPFRIEPVKYQVFEGIVSYNRWIWCPLAWITEIIFIFVEPFLTRSQKLIFLYLFVPQILFILGIIKKC